MTRTLAGSARSGVETDDAGTRWPVVDGIRWRRAGREQLRTTAVALLDAGDVDAARLVLLADADDWWTEPPPPAEQLARAVAAPTMTGCMQLLGYGRVGDYFAHRWSDPTYLAALGLLRAHWPAGQPVVEVCCGTGHALRELQQRGAGPLVGVDVVFSKLWVAQRFVCPQATYVCADAEALPVALLRELAGDAYVLCLDALYFLRDKQAAVRAFDELAGRDGAVVVGHAHTPAEVHSSGEPLDPARWTVLLRAEHVYDDDELRAAALQRRAPAPGAGDGSRAVALVRGRTVPGPDLLTPAGPVRANPLYVDGVLTPPSERWAQEYAAVAEYLPPRWPDPLPADAAGRRLLLDLPEQW